MEMRTMKIPLLGEMPEYVDSRTRNRMDTGSA
jgi:hypothetical protein